jgi:hypothetical protein
MTHFGRFNAGAKTPVETIEGDYMAYEAEGGVVQIWKNAANRSEAGHLAAVLLITGDETARELWPNRAQKSKLADVIDISQ